MAAEAEAHYTKLMRTELGLRVSEVESLQTTAGRLEHRLNTCVTQRDAALDAAAKLATLGCRHRLVWWTFSRWVRACALKPARLLASRGWVETALLSRELGRVEGISIQSEQLVHAGERRLQHGAQRARRVLLPEGLVRVEAPPAAVQ